MEASVMGRDEGQPQIRKERMYYVSDVTSAEVSGLMIPLARYTEKHLCKTRGGGRELGARTLVDGGTWKEGFFK